MGALTIAQRIARIQRSYGLRPDGIVEPMVLSAIERDIGIGTAAAASLVVSRYAVERLVALEITSEAYYRQRLEAPYWPGGGSGVTIGIGYDLGYRTAAEVTRDLERLVDLDDILDLLFWVGTRGEEAKAAAADLRAEGLRLPLEAAKDLFYATSLPRWAARVRRAFPGVEFLPWDAQGALLSVGYNRGTSKANTARRREMRVIGIELARVAGRDFVTQDLLARLAGLIRSMKRLWVGQGLDGLLKRRDLEAAMVEEALREYEPWEEVRL